MGHPAIHARQAAQLRGFRHRRCQDDLIDAMNRLRSIKHMPEHRPTRDLRQHFAGEAGRAEAGLDDGDDAHA